MPLSAKPFCGLRDLCAMPSFFWLSAMQAIPLLAMSLFALTAAAPAIADDMPGVTATEIKIGNTNPYSGPASGYSVIAKLEAAFFKMVNDQGGVAGRQINFISLDDGYSPPKTLEQVRRLVEEERVAFLFSTLGTAPNTAIQRYVNEKKVPKDLSQNKCINISSKLIH
jgi:branched-chain amino acid transport system substrate-binding protein